MRKLIHKIISQASKPMVSEVGGSRKNVMSPTPRNWVRKVFRLLFRNPIAAISRQKAKISINTLYINNIHSVFKIRTTPDFGIYNVKRKYIDDKELVGPTPYHLYTYSKCTLY